MFFEGQTSPVSCAGVAPSVVTWAAGAAVEHTASDSDAGVVLLPGAPEDSVSSLHWCDAMYTIYHVSYI